MLEQEDLSKSVTFSKLSNRVHCWGKSVTPCWLGGSSVPPTKLKAWTLNRDGNVWNESRVESTKSYVRCSVLNRLTECPVCWGTVLRNTITHCNPTPVWINHGGNRSLAQTHASVSGNHVHTVASMIMLYPLCFVSRRQVGMWKLWKLSMIETHIEHNAGVRFCLFMWAFLVCTSLPFKVKVTKRLEE